MLIHIFAVREPAKPLNDAQMCGSFFFYRRMATKDSFTKMYSSPSDLVQLLQSRGLVIFDREKAEHYLSHIEYYRLSAYSYPTAFFSDQARSFFRFCHKTLHSSNNIHTTIII